MKAVLGTRGSLLALWQAEAVAARLRQLGIAITLQIIATEGDRQLERPFSSLEGKGFFTKELDKALLQHDIDLAVHSLKDCPSQAPEGLCWSSYPMRADARDAVVTLKASPLSPGPWFLPMGARVGSSAVRRQAIVSQARPDVQLVPIRGNVPTRLQKVLAGDIDAALLAMAGLQRLADQIDLSLYRIHPLEVSTCVPAPGQGVVVVQTRADAGSQWLQTQLASLTPPDVALAVAAERHLQQALDGGCHTPLGVHVARQGTLWHLAVFWQPHGQPIFLQGSQPMQLCAQAQRRLT